MKYKQRTIYIDATHIRILGLIKFDIGMLRFLPIKLKKFLYPYNMPKSLGDKLGLSLIK